MTACGIKILLLQCTVGRQQACVQFNGKTSCKWPMKQGLPQDLYLTFLHKWSGWSGAWGSQCLDVCWWCYSFHATAQKEQAAALLQVAVDKVATWSNAKKMQLTITNSEVIFFSSENREAAWTPSITLNGQPMPFNPTPKFLGIYHNRTLCFSCHVEETNRKVSARCKVLASLAGKTCRWKKSSLRSVHKIVIAPVINYAAASWQLWLSKFRMETAQNRALCIITRQNQITPAEHCVLRLPWRVTVPPVNGSALWHTKRWNVCRRIICTRGKCQTSTATKLSQQLTDKLPEELRLQSTLEDPFLVPTWPTSVTSGGSLWPAWCRQECPRSNPSTDTTLSLDKGSGFHCHQWCSRLHWRGSLCQSKRSPFTSSYEEERDAMSMALTCVSEIQPKGDALR